MRNKRIQIRVTSEEHDLILANASRNRRSAGRFLRELGTASEVKSQDELEDFKELSRAGAQLASFGNLLKMLSSQGLLTPDLEEAGKQSLEAMLLLKAKAEALKPRRRRKA